MVFSSTNFEGWFVRPKTVYFEFCLFYSHRTLSWTLISVCSDELTDVLPLA